jgi:hypothetical protein
MAAEGSTMGMRTTAVAASVGIAVLAVVGAPPIQAFGTYNSPSVLGQQAEHERITRVLAQDGFAPRTLDLLAGTAGKLGAVGAPDDAVDSSLVPGRGLGPGEKHCDNGDYLDLAGYPQSRDTAARELTTCFRYYEQLLDRALDAAAAMVDEAGTVNAKEATAASCSFPYAIGKRDKTAKCEVLNRLGRALHLAEDFWSHSNWADAADPGKPISIQNPPGLGRTDAPDGLRYPGGGSATVPDGLISGCDDSVPVLGAIECKGRVTHSVLAKDNGSINAGSCAGASPTSKYPRAQVTGGSGQQNFSLAVCGAMGQAQQTWRDLASAIVATYGSPRGDLIVEAITSDTVPVSAPAPEESAEESPSPSATTEESPSASGGASTSASEDATPSQEPSDTANDASAPAAEESAAAEGNSQESGPDRQAAAAAPAAEDVVDLSGGSSSTPMILLAVAVTMGVIAAVWYGVTRRHAASNGPRQE